MEKYNIYKATVDKNYNLVELDKLICTLNNQDEFYGAVKALDIYKFKNDEKNVNGFIYCGEYHNGRYYVEIEHY